VLSIVKSTVSRISASGVAVMSDRQERCPICGARVTSYFEHVDVECKPIADAPRDGTSVVGLYPDDVRFWIRWEERRSHPGGGPELGAGWVDVKEKMPADAPEAFTLDEDAILEQDTK